MCKHNLRTMKKPHTLKVIAGWEMCFWLLMCIWVVLWYQKRNKEEIFINYVEDIGYGTKEQRDDVLQHFQAEMNDWDKGVWIHAVCAFFAIPIAGILYLGVVKRSRFLIVSWILLFLAIAITRDFAIFLYPRAFRLLFWLEFYWLFRIYFILCAGNYCLDLWAETANAVPIDVPLLLPIDDPRSHRGMLNYPEYPMTLDQRQRVYGIGRHIPMNLDWRYIAYPYPGWFESIDEHGPVLVIDTPGYNPDTR